MPHKTFVFSYFTSISLLDQQICTDWLLTAGNTSILFLADRACK